MFICMILNEFILLLNQYVDGGWYGGNE